MRFFRVLALICALSVSLEMKDARAQCRAKDVISNRHLIDDPVFFKTPEVIQSAAGIPVWKTIKIGTSTSMWGLLRQLDAAQCGVGDTAKEILTQPKFVVSPIKIDADLVSVSLGQLGLEVSTLRGIYARARNLGFALASPEVGPQLRLQYFEQPLGEFLNIGMAPIAIREGSGDIFAVGNGGDGLSLVGKDANETIAFNSMARFVFVRTRNVTSSQTKD